MFSRILIANRGEIAVRIAHTCRELGIEVVAVYSDADADAPHVLAADEAVHIGPAPSSESYLNSQAIVAAALRTRAQAVHPGYGFLAESAHFARAVRDAGLTFIGPEPEVIEAMGDKVRARRIAAEAGVPCVPGNECPGAGLPELEAAAVEIGLPVLVKAAAGGGGKGMRVVRQPEDLRRELEAAAREAKAAFGDGRLFLERYLDRPRHIEVQVVGDKRGSLVHLGERECSLQRRHQKIVEEAPSPAVDSRLRDRITAAATRVARAIGYTNAGTIELLVVPPDEIYFLEMNTRLQVEHPVTEWVWGVDLVRAQILVAAGETLPWAQHDLSPRGHAVECRIYAEDPTRNFFPSPGEILLLKEPRGPGVRVDSGVADGFQVPVQYDPLLAKLSTWDETRAGALDRAVRALRDYVILGPTTNIPFLIDLLEREEVRTGAIDTGLVERLLPWQPPATGLDQALAAALVLELQAGGLHERAAGEGKTVATPWDTLGPWRAGGS